MANFKDIARKYTVLGQCFYNLETHEIKPEFEGERTAIRKYKTPVSIPEFTKVIGDFMKEFSEELYRDENVWIGFENEETKEENITIVSINYDNKQQSE